MINISVAFPNKSNQVSPAGLNCRKTKFKHCDEAAWWSSFLFLTNHRWAEAVIPDAGTPQLVAGMWWHVTDGMENASDKVISSTVAKNYGAVW